MVPLDEVDEVRGNEGYVTSSSPPHVNEYYPTTESSSATSTPTMRKRNLPEPEPIDSGLETDDPGIQTDPGYYTSPKTPVGEPIMHFGARSTVSLDEDVLDLASSTVHAGPSESSDETVAHERPPLARASTLPITQGFADIIGPTDSSENVNALVQDELHIGQGPSSAYERQMGYERDREERQEIVALEQERQRQWEYERALEREQERERERQLENVAEAVFFEYGVVVFFGLSEREEKDILDDIEQAGVLRRPIQESEWEIEECHYAVSSSILPSGAGGLTFEDSMTQTLHILGSITTFSVRPTLIPATPCLLTNPPHPALKSRSHLLKLSIAHALAQSTLLARYETLAQRTLSSPLTLSIPRQLATTGSLNLRRHEALKLTGRLFKLRRDVNLVSNVMDVPELFWSEASLKDLYDAVREYMEISPRVESLNEKLGMASDFVSSVYLSVNWVETNAVVIDQLDAIHDHLNNNAMERITWIIIW